MTKPKNAPRRVIQDATRAVTFKITEDDVDGAVCKDGQNCVIARALTGRFGDFLEGAAVGASIVKLYFPGKIIRYATPNKLRKGLINFDETGGEWNLPDGEYTLGVLSASQKLGARPPRWRRPSGKNRKLAGSGGQDMFKGQKLPTRNVVRVSTLR